MKFKICVPKLGKFIDEHGWYINSAGELYFEDMMDGVLIPATENAYKILRFTELHDLYGQEIYEGDIVKLYYHHPNIMADEYEIKYAFGRWMLDDWECLSEHYLDNTKKFGDVCRVVKVGNVYEKKNI